jgi:hypothetical protein
MHIDNRFFTIHNIININTRCLNTNLSINALQFKGKLSFFLYISILLIVIKIRVRVILIKIRVMALLKLRLFVLRFNL